MDAIEAELARLTARTEEIELRLNRVVTDGTNRIGDIEFRLCEATEGCDPMSAATAPLGGDTRRRRPPGRTGRHRPPPLPPAGPNLPSANRRISTGPRRCSVRVTFAELPTLFATFAQSYPGGPLTQEAHYLRGEALRQLGETANAARAYLDAIPATRRAALRRCLLKLGQSLGDLGQTPEACVTLAEVARNTPAAWPQPRRRSPCRGWGARAASPRKTAGCCRRQPALTRAARCCPARWRWGWPSRAAAIPWRCCTFWPPAAPLLGFRVEVATVDHRLRPESADEAAFVARTCAVAGAAP
jgi:hypothetical protein